MERYKNLGGNSSVAGYEIENDFIKVQFMDGSIYLYDSSRPGSYHVNNMKKLAKNGQGLNSYIGTEVKKNYALKLR
jgi:hypothetical protein